MTYLCLNLLTYQAFRQNLFLDIMEIFSLEMGQITSDLLKKAFETYNYMTACLSTSTMFYNISVWSKVMTSELEQRLVQESVG